MTKKQFARMSEAFCLHYARLGNITAAALLAGAPPEEAAAWGTKWLSDEGVRTRLGEYRRALQQDPAALGRTGLLRLAFGEANDAVNLLLHGDALSAEEIENLDLFLLSSLKRDKTVGMEMHFYDRAAALQRLCTEGQGENEKQTANALLIALSGETAEGGEGV